ncbi:MAG: endonuclease/exonuclease/phosphatase family protein [Sulfurimonas sp.]|nr:endonuclease/exonuclease/phosphatase family protein [Sulfurimonas sp.]
MFYPKSKPIEGFFQDASLEDSFSLLSWNIHKENLNPKFKLTLKELLEENSVDFLLFQEYKIDKSYDIIIDQYNYATAPNIETKKHLYGVLTASKATIAHKTAYLSKTKEFFLATKKANLITHHHFKDGSPLIIVNLHAINFVNAKMFKAELDMLYELLYGLDCAVIVSGDFNNWGAKRIRALEEFEYSLGYQRALIEDAKHIKQFLKKPIDHIFYKNLDLLHAKAIDTKKISDHNPLIAKFVQVK